MWFGCGSVWYEICFIKVRWNVLCATHAPFHSNFTRLYVCISNDSAANHNIPYMSWIVAALTLAGFYHCYLCFFVSYCLAVLKLSLTLMLETHTYTSYCMHLQFDFRFILCWNDKQTKTTNTHTHTHTTEAKGICTQ